MKTEILPIASEETFDQACKMLKSGAVIAGPTETVYGLFCRYDYEPALEQLFLIKSRPQTKAIPVLIANQKQLCTLIEQEPGPIARNLMQQYWPGPVTLIFHAKPTLSTYLTAAGPTLALRLPDQPWLRRLLAVLGPLTATSANQSGLPSPRSAEAVLAQLKGRIPLIVDGGPCRLGVPSTVVDISKEEDGRILRRGPAADEIEKLIDRARHNKVRENQQ